WTTSKFAPITLDRIRRSVATAGPMNGGGTGPTTNSTGRCPERTARLTECRAPVDIIVVSLMLALLENRARPRVGNGSLHRAVDIMLGVLHRREVLFGILGASSVDSARNG